jgi:hypothetical protein
VSAPSTPTDVSPEPAPARGLSRFDDWPWPSLYVAFLRLNAVVWLGTGLAHWGRIIGWLPVVGGGGFAEQTIEWQSTIVFYGVIDLVVAVGLWLATPWGVTVWLIAIACQVLTHGALAEIFGERPVRLPFYAVSVLVYGVLLFMARRQAKRRADEEV